MTTWEDDRSSDDIAAQHRRERQVCECGHPIDAHHHLGPCTTIISIESGERYRTRYCGCLDYKEEQG